MEFQYLLPSNRASEKHLIRGNLKANGIVQINNWD